MLTVADLVHFRGPTANWLLQFVPWYFPGSLLHTSGFFVELLYRRELCDIVVPEFHLYITCRNETMFSIMSTFT